MTAAWFAFALLAADATAEAPPKATPEGPKPGESRTHPYPRAERIVVTRTNAFRTGHELGELTRSDTLDYAAQWFADYMADTLRYGHEADGREPHERIAAAGYAYCSVGENIGWQERTKGEQTISVEPGELGREFFVGWRDSPPHRENILTPSFTEIGVGLARSDSGRYFAVQLFGRPQSFRFALELVNETDGPLSYRVADEPFELGVRMWRQHSLCEQTSLRIGESLDRTVEGATRWLVRGKDDELALVPEGNPRDLSTAETDD